MAISHKNIPTSERHPPKGFEDGVPSTVLKRGSSSTVPVYGTVDNDELSDHPWGAEDFQTGVDEKDWVMDRIGTIILDSTEEIHKVFTSMTTATTSYPAYDKFKDNSTQTSVYIFAKGRIGIDFTHNSQDNTGYTRILVNGSEVFEQSILSGSGSVTRAFNPYVDYGDVITIQNRVDSGGTINTTNIVFRADKIVPIIKCNQG